MYDVSNISNYIYMGQFKPWTESHIFLYKKIKKRTYTLWIDIKLLQAIVARLLKYLHQLYQDWLFSIKLFRTTEISVNLPLHTLWDLCVLLSKSMNLVNWFLSGCSRRSQVPISLTINRKFSVILFYMHPQHTILQQVAIYGWFL